MLDDVARAAEAKKGSPFLNTEQAAFYVGLSPRTLRRMRRKGGGPPFRRHAAFVRYHVADVIAWSEATARTTRAQEAAAAPLPGANDRHV
jgi:hypothetical protein